MFHVEACNFHEDLDLCLEASLTLHIEYLQPKESTILQTITGENQVKIEEATLAKCEPQVVTTQALRKIPPGKSINEP